MTTNYCSPDITGREAEIKAVLRDFLDAASVNPDFDVNLAVHEATVYVMQHLPPGVQRVDGYVIAPLLRQAAEDAMNPASPELQTEPNRLTQRIKQLWRKLWN